MQRILYDELGGRLQRSFFWDPPVLEAGAKGFGLSSVSADSTVHHFPAARCNRTDLAPVRRPAESRDRNGEGI